VFKNEYFCKKLSVSSEGYSGVITETAKKQFQEWGWKATDKHWTHSYTLLYDQHCSYLKDTAAKVLEVGVYRGSSINMWQRAFPKAQVYGIDINLKPARLARKNPDRITLLEGSQTDKEFIQKKVVPNGPFDIIVDDASHIAEHQKAGFDLLWGSVKPGGWYIVEDLYYRNYGRDKADDNMMHKLSKLVDIMQERCEIEAMHLYYNIAFIKKRN
jgi:demethylmacrocin O-methyltransferase